MKQNLNTQPLALAKTSHLYKLPVLGEYGVHAFAQGTIDVNSFLVGRSGATSFVFSMTTNAFIHDGIMRGDQLLVDTDLNAANGDLIIAGNPLMFEYFNGTYPSHIIETLARIEAAKQHNG